MMTTDFCVLVTC